MNDHCVALLQFHVLPCESLLDILRRDFVVVRENLDPFQPGHVNQRSACEERADLFDAGLLEPVASRRFANLEAVIHAVAYRLMGEAVELRADLTNLTDNELLIAAAAVRLRVHECAFGMHVESPRSEERHLGVERMADLYHFARANELSRSQHGLRLHVVAGAALVVWPPFRGTSLRVGRGLPRLGH